jgi:hypothetical protein
MGRESNILTSTPESVGSYCCYDIADDECRDNDCKANTRPEESALGTVEMFWVARARNVPKPAHYKKAGRNETGEASNNLDNISDEVFDLCGITRGGEDGWSEKKWNPQRYNESYYFDICGTSDHHDPPFR